MQILQLHSWTYSVCSAKGLPGPLISGSVCPLLGRGFALTAKVTLPQWQLPVKVVEFSITVGGRGPANSCGLYAGSVAVPSYLILLVTGKADLSLRDLLTACPLGPINQHPSVSGPASIISRVIESKGLSYINPHIDALVFTMRQAQDIGPASWTELWP